MPCANMSRNVPRRALVERTIKGSDMIGICVPMKATTVMLPATGTNVVGAVGTKGIVGTTPAVEFAGVGVGGVGTTPAVEFGGVGGVVEVSVSLATSGDDGGGKPYTEPGSLLPGDGDVLVALSSVLLPATTGGK